MQYLRLDKSFAEVDLKGFDFNKWNFIFSGNEICFVTLGGILEEVLEARISLINKGYSVAIATTTVLNNLNSDDFLESLKRFNLVVTIEEHIPIGGLGGLISELLSSVKTDCVHLRLGVNPKMAGIVGSQKYLRKMSELDSQQIVYKTEMAYKSL